MYRSEKACVQGLISSPNKKEVVCLEEDDMNNFNFQRFLLPMVYDMCYHLAVGHNMAT